MILTKTVKLNLSPLSELQSVPFCNFDRFEDIEVFDVNAFDQSRIGLVLQLVLEVFFSKNNEINYVFDYPTVYRLHLRDLTFVMEVLDVEAIVLNPCSSDVPGGAF